MTHTGQNLISSPIDNLNLDELLCPACGLNSWQWFKVEPATFFVCNSCQFVYHHSTATSTKPEPSC